jgi:hypothetical protein
VVLHPTPDSAYELTTQYQALARRLTEEHPYALGGQAHGPLLLASVLSVAELRESGTDGAMYEKFRERLAASVARDHQRGGKLLGYNSNGHTAIRGRGMLRDLGGLYYNDVTYSNTSYSGQ